MYKLTFKLKQHTPIIHFQHEQDGATLRATEVKPKLDRFILIYLGNGNYDNGISIAKEKGWLIGQTNSINYKIDFKQDGERKYYYVTSNPNSNNNDGERFDVIKRKFNATYLNETQYFANNKNLNKSRGVLNIEKELEVKLGILGEELEVNIKSNSNLLFDLLNKNELSLLRSFFCTQTFGTRQTKGFGVFLISDTKINSNIFKNDPSIIGVFKKDTDQTWENKIRTIAQEYSILKRGQNEQGRNPYIKSKLWDYLCNGSSISWEKRKIKNHLISNNHNLFNNLEHKETIHRIDTCNSQENNNYMYIRALLGLAENFEFLMRDNSRLKIQIIDSSLDENKIVRFQSPISYIITDEAIYLIARKINHTLFLTKDINLNIIPRKFKFQIDSVPDFSLEIPNNFDLLNFLNTYSGYTQLK